MSTKRQVSARPQIFVSYAHDAANENWVHEFADSLQRHGADVWLDAEIKPGTELGRALESSLKRSDLIVAVLGASEPATPWMLFEFGAAMGMGKEFISVVPKELKPSRMPSPMRSSRIVPQSSPDTTARELLAISGLSSLAN